MRPGRQVTGMVLTTVLVSACGLGPASANTAPSAQAENIFGARSDRQIAQAQELLRSRPESVVGMNHLAQAYLQKAREVGDPSYYPKVESLLKAALGRDPANLESTTMMGVLLLSKHRFREALEWGNKGRGVNPPNSAPLGFFPGATAEVGSY